MDTALKQRLIGAAVLIALAVFFLPMLVKGPAPDSGVSGVSLDMPDAPEDGMQTRDLPLTAPGEVPKGGAVGLNATPIDRNAPPATGALGASPTDGASGTTTAADPATTGEPVDPAAAADPNAVAASALPPTAAGGDYAVHFGAYASAKSADTVVALAKAAQLPAYSEPATVGGKAAWRVRIGPYATRADAESARLKALDVRSDVPVRVVVLDAETAAGATPAAPVPVPATAPAKPTPAEAAGAAVVKPIEAPKPAEPKPTPTTKPVASPVAAKPAPAKPDPKPAVPTPVAAKPAVSKPAAAAPAASASATSAPNTPTPAAPKPAPANRPADGGALVAVAPKPKPAAAAPAAAKVGFAVQLGAFGNPADATALRDRLRAAGFTAFTETVSTDKGALTRVRVGPVVDRASADQLKAQVQAKTGVDGIVRSHP